MGRTWRKRSQRKARNYCSCGAKQEIVLLNSWLSENGMKCNKKLVLSMFNETGRGVLTKKKIYPGEEFLCLPLNMTINVTTLLMDIPFCSIFLENKTKCLLDYKQSVSFQSLMAFYVSFIKIQETISKWFIYIQNLPQEYTVPYFLPNEVKCYLDTEVQSVISKQKDIINLSFNIFEQILNKSTSKHNSVDNLKKSFSLSIYEWAYFTINTRCVYMDLTKVIDLKNIDGSIINLINDNTKISLCPYLDMINHSPNARNETKLMVSRNCENVHIWDLSKELLADVSFSIYTKNNFDPYTQVFICYGDSHNLKLITEYGFFLPNNDLDYVSFSFECVNQYLNSKSIKLSQEQTSFINSHGLNKDLYIDGKGLSFNFYGLLMVVKYYYSRGMDVSRLIYSAAICSNDTNLNDIIIPMVTDKLSSVRQSIDILENFENQCVILSNCIALMYQYVNILKKFIKC